MTCMVKAFKPIWPNVGGGHTRKTLIKRVVEVIVYSENAAHHKVKNGVSVGSLFMTFNVPERHEHLPQGDAA